MSQTPQLRRALGVRDVVFFYIAAVLSLRWIASAAAAGPSALVIWLIALLAFFLPLAFCVIELSSRYPQEGGVYLWSRKAFGDFAGFLTGWTYWTSNLVYFPSLLYFSASTALFVAPERTRSIADSPFYFIAVALGGILLATWMNVAGLNIGKWLHDLGTYATWIPAGTLIIGGFWLAFRYGSASSFDAAAVAPSTGLSDIIFWSTIAFAFGGLEAASSMGEEIRDARRTVPRAIVISGIVITAVYLLGTAAVLVAIPARAVSSLEGLNQAIASIASRLGVPLLGSLSAALIAISGLGGVGAWIASTARLPFVAGIDHLLPPAFGRLHPRWKTPHVALWTQCAVACAIAVLGQAGSTVRAAYDILVSLGVIAYFIPFLFLFAAMIRLQREPAGPEVIRVPGGKPAAFVVAVLGFATTTIAILLALVPSPNEPDKALSLIKVIGLSAVLPLAGVIIYRVRRREGSGVGQAV